MKVTEFGKLLPMKAPVQQSRDIKNFTDEYKQAIVAVAVE